MSLSLSKTTHNFALNRQMELIQFSDDHGSGEIKIAVYVGDNDCEPDFILSQRDHLFNLISNIHLDSSLWKSLPQSVESEYELRRVLDYIFKNNKKGK